MNSSFRTRLYIARQSLTRSSGFLRFRTTSTSKPTQNSKNTQEWARLTKERGNEKGHLIWNLEVNYEKNLLRREWGYLKDGVKSHMGKQESPLDGFDLASLSKQVHQRMRDGFQGEVSSGLKPPDSLSNGNLLDKILSMSNREWVYLVKREGNEEQVFKIELDLENSRKRQVENGDRAQTFVDIEDVFLDKEKAFRSVVRLVEEKLSQGFKGLLSPGIKAGMVMDLLEDKFCKVVPKDNSVKELLKLVPPLSKTKLKLKDTTIKSEHYARLSKDLGPGRQHLWGFEVGKCVRRYEMVSVSRKDTQVVSEYDTETPLTGEYTETVEDSKHVLCRLLEGYKGEVSANIKLMLIQDLVEMLQPGQAESQVKELFERDEDLMLKDDPDLTKLIQSTTVALQTAKPPSNLKPDTATFRLNGKIVCEISIDFENLVSRHTYFKPPATLEFPMFPLSLRKIGSRIWEDIVEFGSKGCTIDISPNLTRFVIQTFANALTLSTIKSNSVREAVDYPADQEWAFLIKTTSTSAARKQLVLDYKNRTLTEKSAQNDNSTLEGILTWVASNPVDKTQQWEEPLERLVSRVHIAFARRFYGDMSLGLKVAILNQLLRFCGDTLSKDEKSEVLAKIYASTPGSSASEKNDFLIALEQDRFLHPQPERPAEDVFPQDDLVEDGELEEEEVFVDESVLEQPKIEEEPKPKKRLAVLHVSNNQLATTERRSKSWADLLKEREDGKRDLMWRVDLDFQRGILRKEWGYISGDVVSGMRSREVALVEKSMGEVAKQVDKKLRDGYTGNLSDGLKNFQSQKGVIGIKPEKQWAFLVKQREQGRDLIWKVDLDLERGLLRKQWGYLNGDKLTGIRSKEVLLEEKVFGEVAKQVYKKVSKGYEGNVSDELRQEALIVLRD